MRLSNRITATCFLLAAGCATCAASQPRFKTMALFRGKNGARPSGAMIQGLDGNLYSTTSGIPGHRNLKGLVFRITPAGALTTVHALPGFSVSGLALGTDGTFYGTTTGDPRGPSGVFQATAAGALTDLYSTCLNCGPGWDFYAPLYRANDGNFYGTTVDSGTNSSGTVFRITPAGSFTTLYNFCPQTGCADGRSSYAPLIQASDGNLYGTNAFGGNYPTCPDSAGCGTIFRITLDGALTTVYTFCQQTNCPDGAHPFAGLLQASDGELYGTTAGTGAPVANAGTIFKITTEGAFTLLHTFGTLPNGADGANPMAGLIQATDGNFYGTTTFGADFGGGVIFQLTPAGVLTPLHHFCPTNNRCPEGGGPYDSLFQATDGNFYGTAYGGYAPKFGSVFRLSMGLAPFVRALPGYGSAGSQITILGSHLSGASGVTFGGVPAASFSVNPTGTAITATVPTGAKSGEIRVRTIRRSLKSDVPFVVTP